MYMLAKITAAALRFIEPFKTQLGCFNGDKPRSAKGKILENGQVRPCDVKVGDRILFGNYSGTEVKLEREELVVRREEDLMAVIESK